VVALRRRLTTVGDLAPAGSTAAPVSDRFDADVAAAVQRFQRRHGLTADGIAGRRTVEALDVPVGDRIDQLRVNLERGRWVLHEIPDDFVLVNIAEIPDDFVLVNIAGFRVGLVRDGAMVWFARAQVGKQYRQTPVFAADMRYLVFNPDWTVPPTILAKDVLPAIQKDVSYLERKNMAVFDREGRRLDPAGIDWSRYRGGDFPYIVRQGPGPTNALGLVKFIFPNPHFVFLHDTPSRGLFDREERTFSSGCIRVENPFELCELLLADQEGWDRARIDATIAGGETRTVHLSEPLPVVLIYWTAFVDLGGDLNFRRDVYERDAEVLAGLESGPVPPQRTGEMLDRWGIGQRPGGN
jgi:murein L,D-transpeptidase YcbB/YkuD